MSKTSRFARGRTARLADPHYPDYPTVNSQTSRQLWDRLVADGTRRSPTPVSWLTRAVVEIARQRHSTPEAVFIELQQAVLSQCGMPLTVQPGRL